jgi:hypothetical protein
MGDAVLVDLGGGKNLIALLAHVDKSIDLDGMNYLALRAYNAAGRKVSFNDMSRMTGPVPVQGVLIPVLVTFGDPGDPATARAVSPDGVGAALGKGFHLHGISAEVGAERFLAARFRRPVRRAGDTRDRGQTAVVESA